MFKLLTFETFVPKKLEGRAEDLKRIEAQRLDKYNVFLAKFKQNLLAIQGKTSSVHYEQAFIGLMQDLSFSRYDTEEKSFEINLYSSINDLVWLYDYDSDQLFFKNSNILKAFKPFHNAKSTLLLTTLGDMFEKYFGFRPSKIS